MLGGQGFGCGCIVHVQGSEPDEELPALGEAAELADAELLLPLEEFNELLDEAEYKSHIHSER